MAVKRPLTGKVRSRVREWEIKGRWCYLSVSIEHSCCNTNIGSFPWYDTYLLGIKNKDGKYIIEIPSYSRTVYAAGSRIRYYHEDNIDINTVYIPGPTTDKLTIVVGSVLNHKLAAMDNSAIDQFRIQHKIVIKTFETIFLADRIWQ